MNLQPIYPTEPTFIAPACRACNGHVSIDTGYADLDGKPFEAYYCADCAAFKIAKAASVDNCECFGYGCINCMPVSEQICSDCGGVFNLTADHVLCYQCAIKPYA